MQIDITNVSNLLDVGNGQRILDEINLEAQLKKFIAAASMPGVRVVDAFCVGIINPDTILSKLQVEKSLIGFFLDRLYDLDTLQVRKITIFPYGNPDITMLHVDVELCKR
ncbi:MAG: hypothetical protein ACK2UW_20760 [Anaerolineales bacterium]|jgi:hypothetical protein